MRELLQGSAEIDRAGAERFEPPHVWWFALGISLAAGLAIVAPFCRLGNASGHDFEFHLASWLEAARQWRQGIWYPRWHEWANHGFGEPRFIFYPPLSWMLGAGLSFLVPWNAVPGAFIVLAQTIAGVSAFALARGLMNWRGALLAAACYAANPYAMLVIYVRSDFAELLAAAILPLLVLSALEVCGLAPSAKLTSGRIACFAVLFAAIWLCNAPAGVLASYAVAAAFGWYALRRRNARILAHGAAGLALGLALAAFFLLPAAYEQNWVNIGQALSAGLTPAENFLFAHTRDLEHDAFNAIASWIALLMFGLTAIARLISWRYNRDYDRNHATSGVNALFTALAVLATLLMWRFTLPLWMLLPKLRFVQFPWRWLLVLAVPYSIWLGAAIAQRKKATIWATCVALAAICLWTGSYLARHTWWDGDDVPALRSWVEQGQGFEGTDEYDPAGDDRTELPNGGPPVRILPAAGEQNAPSAIVEIRRWTAEQRILQVKSHDVARLAIRLLNYPAWRVEVNGKRVIPQHPEQTKQMIVPVSGGESSVTIAFERTTDRTLGIAVSWIAALTILALFFPGRFGPAASHP